MDEKDYFWKTKKRPPKNKPRAKPLPKAKEKYLEAEEDFEQSLLILEIKYEKKFQFKSTKHWHFDFHLIQHRILFEISGGPWSGGRGGKLKNKAGGLDRYDDAAEMDFSDIEPFVTVTAGHSNKDSSAVNGKFKEAELVSQFRNVVAYYLREAGIQYKTDGDGTLNQDLNSAIKLIKGSSVAVEFHMNAAASKQANGVETIALPKRQETSSSAI